MQHGTKPSVLDKRDFSYHLSFGTVTTAYVPNLEYNLDALKTMPDQNADGYPYGCTGYTQADISGDEDDSIYKPAYTYGKTCLIENHDTNQGCDIRNSIKSTRVYGVQRLDETTDVEAETHRRGAYFNVYCDSGRDWFDSLRIALRTNKRPISIGTPWFGEWTWAGYGNIVSKNPDGTFHIESGGIPTGIMPIPNTHADSRSFPWHNYKICGEKIIDGNPYLLGKTWQGTNFGDKGWCYFPREAINAAMEVRGSIAFTFAKVNSQDITPIKVDILETVLLFLYRILRLKLYA